MSHPPHQELEQSRHELQLKLSGCQADREAQVAELESDVQELSAQVEHLSRALAQARRDEKRTQEDLSEQTRCFQERLENVSASCWQHEHSPRRFNIQGVHGERPACGLTCLLNSAPVHWNVQSRKFTLSY